MDVVVAGGTGLVGRAISRRLLDAGHHVRVMARSRPGPGRMDARATWIAGDVTKPEGLEGALTGAEIVVDAVQFPNSPVENPKKGYTFEAVDFRGTVNLADAAVRAGVRQLIDISGMGAADDAPYHWQRFKWQEEQHILSTGMPYTIFRPTWMFGEDDVALNRFLKFARYLPFVPVIGKGKTRTNILFLGDLAAHVVAAAGNDKAMLRTFEIGGPEVLTMDEIIHTALDVSGRRRFLLHQPKALMKTVAAVVQHLPGRPLTPDAIDFITMEGIADTAALRETFGLPLTPLREGLAYLRP